MWILALALTACDPPTDKGATPHDSPPDSGDSAVDTSSWECADDGLEDATTLCWEHGRYTCDLSTIGLRRGDWLCWPAHAFCPEPGVYCADTTEGWAEVPIPWPDDLRAVAEGVLNEPELVFSSPIDGDFTPLRTLEVASPSEAYDAIYHGEVGPGDEIVIADGTYSDCYVGFEATGEPGAPIVLRAETPGGVTLDGCAVYMGGSYLVLSGFRFTGRMGYTPIAMGYTGLVCDHCAVRGVTIDTMLPDAPTNRPYVQIYGNDNEVSDSSFIGKANGSAVITVDRPDPTTALGARIYRNAFTDRNNAMAAPGETNGFEVIRAGYSMDYFTPGLVIIEGNLFERCDGEVEMISLKSGNNAVRFNTFRDNAGQITVRDGFGNVVEGNYLLGEEKIESAGVRASGANTLIIGNHIQDLAPGGSRWRYPVALVTGTDDPYGHYTSTFESAVLFNRAVSPMYGFALDTGEDYPPTFYPPYDNVYASNLFFAGEAEEGVVGWTFPESLEQNRVEGNAVQIELGLAGFEVSSEAPALTGELWRVPGFDASIADQRATDWLSGEALELAERALVLDGPEIYDQVPLLEAGDVGGP